MLSEVFNRWQSCPVHFSSIKVKGDRSVVAASLGQGIYHRPVNGEWTQVSEGLPAGVTVNRLQLVGNKVHACTNRGLYRLENQQWCYDGLCLPCYQYKEEAGFGFAATHQGLMYRTPDDKWQLSAADKVIVYDFLFTPQFLFLGMEQGIAMYDRMTDQWASFKLERGITSLAADRERLIGASDRGELIVGSRQGQFETIQFGDMFVFSVISRPPGIYVCTDKGLFRLSSLQERVMLYSIKPGVPVTDMDWHGSDLFMATLTRGIQTMRA